MKNVDWILISVLIPIHLYTSMHLTWVLWYKRRSIRLNGKPSWKTLITSWMFYWQQISSEVMTCLSVKSERKNASFFFNNVVSFFKGSWQLNRVLSRSKVNRRFDFFWNFHGITKFMASKEVPRVNSNFWK